MNALCRFNPSASVREERIGSAETPILVMDDVFAEPGAAADLARHMGKSVPHPGDFYPGLRFPLADEFHAAFVDWLNALTPKPALLADRKAVSLKQGFVAVVTTPSADLLPIQTTPHFDTTDVQIYAAVLYLFEGGFGGTSFYHHRSSGLELLTRQTEPLYRAALHREVGDPAGLPRQYMNGSTKLFERIHRQEPRFNRMVLYPGRILHAGDLEPDFPGAIGTRDGRLTITALCRLVPH